MRMSILPLGLACALVCAGCINVYKMAIPQGNIVNQEMIDKLKPGMTRAQVRFVLGTPLISDPFHADRWDYVQVQRKSTDAAPETRTLTVIFNGDVLTRLEGDVIAATPSPAEPEHAATPGPAPEPLSRSN